MIADSCFLIDLLAGDSGAIRLFEKQKLFFVPTIVITEFCRGILDQKKAEEFLQGFVPLDITASIAQETAVLMKENDLLGKPVDIIDSTIAACALNKNMPVVTRNTKHFQRFSCDIVTY